MYYFNIGDRSYNVLDYVIIDDSELQLDMTRDVLKNLTFNVEKGNIVDASIANGAYLITNRILLSTDYVVHEAEHPDLWVSFPIAKDSEGETV